MDDQGICPVCNGTKRQPAGDNKYIHMCAGYDKSDHTLACKNCGGQMMYHGATGMTPLRKDGTPCKHEYKVIKTRNCYTEYKCKHCGHRYEIDSGD